MDVTNNGSPPDDAPDMGPDLSLLAAQQAADLYVEFGKLATTKLISNSVVANAACMLLSEALANMAEVHTLPQDQYNSIVGEVLDHFQSIAMSVSHELAEGVVETRMQNLAQTQNALTADPPAADEGVH